MEKKSHCLWSLLLDSCGHLPAIHPQTHHRKSIPIRALLSEAQLPCSNTVEAGKTEFLGCFSRVHLPLAAPSCRIPTAYSPPTPTRPEASGPPSEGAWGKQHEYTCNIFGMDSVTRASIKLTSHRCVQNRPDPNDKLLAQDRRVMRLPQSH